jgi:hypothetical protein
MRNVGFPVSIITVLVCLLFSRNGFAQDQDTATFKLYLIGDAGEGDTSGATLHDLRIELLKNPNSAVIFLGDNCYVNSFFLPIEVGGYDGSKVARRRLMAQLNILRGYQGYVYFIPGNHDWWNHINLKRGRKRLIAEQLFIEDTLKKFTTIRNHDAGTFLPSNGDPGPISKNFNNGKTRIIFIDSYRLIIEEGARRHKDTLFLKAFYDELKNQLTDATNKHQKIIVVAHHPIHAKGKHSFPLAFWERLNRRFADANANYPPYNRMATHLDSVLKEHNHPDIYYVSGHEHSLEYFFNDSLHYLVSGAGSKVDKVGLESCTDDTECLQWGAMGFFEIAFYGRKETVLMYHRKDTKSGLQVHCLAGCK